MYQEMEAKREAALTVGSGFPIITQSSRTFCPSIASRDLSGWVMVGGVPAKSPSVGGASRTMSLQEALASPMQFVITTVNVPESSGKARLISSVVDVLVLRIYSDNKSVPMLFL